MKKVIIVGVGALGSHVVQFLRNVAELKIIDFDYIEQKNILSQFHGKPGVGKVKVLALQQLMNFTFGIKLEVISNKLVDNNALQLLSNSDLIIDCLDNAEGRIVIQQFVRKNKIPCLHGGLAANGEFGISIWDENYQIQTGSEGVATCENGDQLPFIALVSAYIARSAQDFLAHNKRYGYMISPQSSTRV